LAGDGEQRLAARAGASCRLLDRRTLPGARSQCPATTTTSTKPGPTSVRVRTSYARASRTRSTSRITDRVARVSAPPYVRIFASHFAPNSALARAGVAIAAVRFSSPASLAQQRSAAHPAWTYRVGGAASCRAAPAGRNSRHSGRCGAGDTAIKRGIARQGCSSSPASLRLVSPPFFLSSLVFHSVSIGLGLRPSVSVGVAVDRLGCRAGLVVRSGLDG